MSKHRRGRTRKAGLRQPNGRIRRRGSRGGPAFEDPGLPTHERFKHGAGVARLDKPIADDEGRPVRPFRAATFLSTLQADGLIDKATLVAAEDFRAQFYKARFDPLGAAELVRRSRSTGGTEPSSRIHARHAVWAAVVAVGGLASPGGSCLWHVVGWECELARWALEQGWVGRRISLEAAHGILIATLASLKEHYR